MKLPKNFCPAPFIQLQTSHDGKCGPCPHNGDRWRVPGGVSQKWRSAEMESLRRSFLSGQRDPVCDRCWREEDAGKPSLRQRLLSHRQSRNLEQGLGKYVESGQYQQYPRVLTLIPGNECNLACATCSGYFSSKWNSLLRSNPHSTHRVMENWNMSDLEYQDIVDNSHRLIKIELFGGEPFLNKRNRRLLLEPIMEKGTSRNMTLYFNTNGTLFDEDYMTRLSRHFRHLEIRQSMDGLGEQFEYLRYGARFDEVCENADRFRSLPNSDFGVICTVSIFNVMRLDEIDEFLRGRGWPAHYIIAYDQDHLRLHNIPDRAKEKITLSDRFSDIMAYMKARPCDQHSWRTFLGYTEELQKSRGLDFASTFPELHRIAQEN